MTIFAKELKHSVMHTLVIYSQGCLRYLVSDQNSFMIFLKFFHMLIKLLYSIETFFDI